MNPFQEVRDLVSTDAKCDCQYFPTAHFLTKCLVKTCSTPFDVTKVKRRGIGDHLNVIGIVEISIRYGDRSAVCDIDRLWKSGAEIGILRAALPDEPTRVHVQMLEIRETADIFCSSRRAPL
jgi:hypothetical protein